MSNLALNQEQKDACRESSTSLAVIEVKNPALVFVAGGADTILNRIREEVAKEKPMLDISTEEGRRYIASFAYKIARSKTALDKMGASLNDDHTKAIKVVNSERKRLWDELEKIQEEVRAPLTEWENADKIRTSTHEGAIKSMTDLTVWDAMAPAPAAAEVSARLEQLPKLYQRDWQEFAGRATLAHDQVHAALIRLLAERKKAETDAAELARLKKEDDERKQKERDDQIAREAEERTREEEQKKAAEATRKAQEESDRKQRESQEREDNERKARIDAEERAAQAEKDRKENHERRLQGVAARAIFDTKKTSSANIQARLDSLKDFDAVDWQEYAERAKKTREDVVEVLEKMLSQAHEREAEAAEEQRRQDQAAADKRAQDAREAEERREREESAKREADTKHKAKINNEAMAALIKVLGTAISPQDQAKAVIIAIASGKVPHVKITY